MGIAVVLVLVSLSILLAYMGWRTWHIANTILAVGILWSSMFFFYLAARVLHTHKAWGIAVRNLEGQVRTAKAETQLLQEGDRAKGQIGVREARSRLTQLIVTRGHVWYGVTVDKRDPQTAGATVTVPAPTPHLIVPKMVVFAFEPGNADNPGRYVGEFHVTDVKDKTAELAPALTLTDDERQLLAQSNGPWTLYGMMPVDDPRVYAALNDAQKQKLPAELAAELINPKRPLEKLTDFALLFQQLQARKVLLTDAIQKTEAAIARTENAIKETNQDIAIRQKERENLAADLKRFQYELQVIAAYEKTITQQVSNLQKATNVSSATAQALAAELTVRQLKAAAEINRRTLAPAVTDNRAAR